MSADLRFPLYPAYRPARPPRFSGPVPGERGIPAELRKRSREFYRVLGAPQPLDGPETLLEGCGGSRCDRCGGRCCLSWTYNGSGF
jgi:hypothetical protein